MHMYSKCASAIASKMTRAEYNRFRGWALPGDEDGSDLGYFLEQDNVVCWKPAEVVAKQFSSATKLDFGQALHCLKQGMRVARTGWNGKAMYLVLTLGTTVLSERVRSGAAAAVVQDGATSVVINSHVDMKTADGSVCVGWLASQADMLADDWQVVEENAC